MNVKQFFFGMLVFFPLILPGCGGSNGNLKSDHGTRTLQGDNPRGGVVYLRNNIHAQAGARDVKASYANWTEPGAGHIVVPVNTAVKIGRFKRGFLMTTAQDGRRILFEYNARNMGIGVGEYLNLITSPQRVSLTGFSEIDLKGIQEGRGYNGMTKEGIRVALGYPAAHMTPLLKSKSWIYWKNRFKRKVVEFDAQDKVINIR